MTGFFFGLAKQKRKSRRLSIDTLEARDVPSASDLGAATDFNLVALNNIDVHDSDVEGRVTVGNDAAIKSYGIGDKLPDSFGTRDDLIVGHDLTYQYGQVFKGNIVYGDTGVLDGVGTPNGTVRQEANVFDFAAASADLTAKSTQWGGEDPNGLTSVRHGNITMRGMNPTLDFFTLTQAQLDGATSIVLKAPATATVIINVPDGSVDIKNLGFSLRGIAANHVLWNFPEATDINISGVGLKGSFLAPQANFNFNNGQITGTVIANNYAGNGELHLDQSRINVAIPPYASIQGFVFVDVDQNHAYDSSIDGLQDGAGVTLTGIDALGRRINRSYLTVDGGQFNFGNLWAGTYTVTVQPPFKYINSMESGIPGTVNGSTTGTPGVNQVSSISLGSGDNALNYELPLLGVSA
ncbi:choice-of-anchor A family protein [Zavarzinella formosa]|uniref:choice-of-anchor A family protein n=1 Tax=Zavarzinella formosa TaxID=360055 RepID=UPI00030016B9|nr:choice-of-anchor A family protein [Zavarzinella formosa]